MSVNVPKSVVFVVTFGDATDYFDAANNSTELKVLWSFRQSDCFLILFKPLIQIVAQALIFICRQCKLLTGVHKYATTKISAPCSVFNGFNAVDNEPCPGLSNAKSFHAISLSGINRMVNSAFG